MDEEKKFHPVVETLLRRMETHPEEFQEEGWGERWEETKDWLEPNLSEAEAAALGEAHRQVVLNKIHETVMDEIMNGDECRREEAEAENQS